MRASGKRQPVRQVSKREQSAAGTANRGPERSFRALFRRSGCRLSSNGYLAAALAAFTLVACNRESSPTVPTPPPSASGPDRVFEVTGTVTALSAARAVAAPLQTPFTLEVTDRGVGGAEITGATVGGRSVQINWQGGQPLPVTGSGAVELNGVSVSVSPAAISLILDGEPRRLLPGTYRLGSSVAVGEAGLSRPVDSLTFTAGDDTGLATRLAHIDLPAREFRIEGTSGQLRMEGQLVLAAASGERTVGRLLFEPGTYAVTLTPVAGGYTVLGRLEGRVIE